LSAQHQPSALPNGNILVFDNRIDSGKSRLIEVNPVTERIEWEYVGGEHGSFFSSVAGGCELLANGNVLVTLAQEGRVFELTKAEQIVWDHTVSETGSPSQISRVALYRVSAVSSEIAGRILAASSER
jgi:hypothetical protein